MRTTPVALIRQSHVPIQEYLASPSACLHQQYEPPPLSEPANTGASASWLGGMKREIDKMVILELLGYNRCSSVPVSRTSAKGVVKAEHPHTLHRGQADAL